MTARYDLQTLRFFASAVELRNLARAAAQGNIATSALSKRISDLEDTVGTRLLYRQRRGVEPTPAGLALLHHVQQIVYTLEKMEMELAEYSQGIRGHVRMLANISSIVQFLPPDLSAFSKAHPEIKVDLREASTPSIISDVIDGRADFGVVIGPLEDQRLQTIDYRPDELVMVVPRHHPLASKPAVYFEDALIYEFIGLHSGSGWENFINGAARKAGQTVRTRMRVPSFDAIFRMVEADLGVSIAPAQIVRTESEAGRVRIVHLKDSWSKRMLTICYRDLAAMPVAARLLIDHLKQPPAAA